MSLTALVPLQVRGCGGSPLVCIPGAGASVTTFIHLVAALGNQHRIYGLQPRGIDLAEQPHETVEAAAMFYLSALAPLQCSGPVHLLGHSYGGLVAFEMALRLTGQGARVLSLTLVDTEPPEILTEAALDVSISQIFQEFVDVFEETFDRPLGLNRELIRAEEVTVFLDDLHGALVKAGCLPRNTSSGMLAGPLATFAAARRVQYTPLAKYQDKLNLILVTPKREKPSSPMPTGVASLQQELYLMGWRARTAELNAWHGPGHHFSILQNPHVSQLAEWWTKTTAEALRQAR